VFAIYQKYDDVKEVMYWLYPDLRDWEPDEKVRIHALNQHFFRITAEENL